MPKRVALASQLMYLLSQAERVVGRDLATVLAHEGVTTEQWRVLNALSDADGVTMGDLAQTALLPHPTLTRIVDRLVDATLIYRRLDARDRRRVVIHLSDEGRHLAIRVSQAAWERQHQVETAFGAERTRDLMAELDALVHCLNESQSR